MNKSNLVHAAVGVILQLAVFIITWNPWYGFALVTGIFWSREQAQKQYHIANGRSIKELQWYEGGDMTKWNKDSLLDFLAPFVATLVIAICLR